MNGFLAGLVAGPGWVMTYFADLSPYTYLQESKDAGLTLNVGWLDAAHEFTGDRVQGPDGKRYAAPTLIHHYVVEHGYRPPDEFVAAVRGR